MVALASARDPALVLLADCPVCLSAGCVRRGVCDICGARLTEGRLDGGRPDEEDLVPA